MTNRSPKILWPIDYRLLIDVIDYLLMLLITHRWSIDYSSTKYYTAHKKHIFCFLVPFFRLWFFFKSVLDVLFFITGVSVDENYPFIKSAIISRHVETWSANHKNRRFVQNITLPNSLFNNKTTEQEPTSLKVKLTSTIRIDYVVLRFLSVDVFSKVKLLNWLRETAGVNSYITHLKEMILMSNEWKEWLINAIND